MLFWTRGASVIKCDTGLVKAVSEWQELKYHRHTFSNLINYRHTEGKPPAKVALYYGEMCHEIFVYKITFATFNKVT